MKNKNWLTSEASTELDAWENSHRVRWESEEIDPKEVRADLEAHLWHGREDNEEAVTLTQVKMAIDEMSLPSMATWQVAPALTVSSPRFPRRFLRFLFGPFFLGIWPLLIVLLEIFTGVLGSMFFDPISRISQVILILGFAILGLYNLFDTFEKPRPRWLTLLRGAGVIVAGYWAILLIPVLILGAIAYGICVVFTVGIGLLALPIFLLCAMAAAAPLLLAIGFLKRGYADYQQSTWIMGMLLGLFLLLFVEAPAYITRYGVANHKPALIRSFGSAETLLTMCYEGSNGRRSFTDTSGFFRSLRHLDLFGDGVSHDLSKENERELYYRVTGRAFNSEEPPPSHLLSYGRRQASRAVTFDENLGGDGVSARVADLDLATSRLDAHIDSASGLAYWEWTMEFDNSGLSNKEARMQLLLPPGGVVSRLTLWINDEAQEAAFSSTEKVAQAYKSVAVAEQRDPVLVRWVASDRVLVQCFPILPAENMRIRIGITAALDSDGRLFLPRIIEKNFGISADLDTDIWIQGDLEMSLEGLQGKGAKDQWRETHGSLSAQVLMAAHTHLQCQLPEPSKIIWANDPFSGKKLVRTRLPDKLTKSKKKVVLVIDGSGYFQNWAKATDEAITALRNCGYEVEVVLAAAEEVHSKITSLSDYDFAGGQDCITALETGLRIANEKNANQLIWLHGSQPVTFTGNEGFLQLLERGFYQIDFSVVDLSGGPNRLLESAAKRIGLASSARPGSPAQLSAEIAKLVQARDQKFHWLEQAEAPREGKQVWDQLARWRIWQQVRTAAIGSTKDPHLTRQAAKYQLVTPISGAVVLENARDYRRFDLQQVEGSTTPSIPSIPEPSITLLGFLASLLLLRRSRP